MTQKYHHGQLKQALIEAGIEILNVTTPEQLSLRKVANQCGVSHAAPYKHFKNKDDLLHAIYQYIYEQFTMALKEAILQISDEPYQQIIRMGSAYITFFVHHPNYFHFFFIERWKNKNIENLSTHIEQSLSYRFFTETAIHYFQSVGIPKERYQNNIIAMWSIVHGITLMIVTKMIQIPIHQTDWLDHFLTEHLNIQ